MGRFHPHHDHDHDHSHRDVGDHGGYETGLERVIILENILSENNRVADIELGRTNEVADVLDHEQVELGKW